MTRIEEINLMEREQFRSLFRTAVKKEYYTRLFTRGVETLSVEEISELKDIFSIFGLTTPISNDEMQLIVCALSARAAKAK